MAKIAFDDLKNALISREVILMYPDFDKGFQLTTDAENSTIGAVLSQDDKPISFICLTLNKTEKSHAAMKK